MFQISSLHKAFGARVLFDNISWHVQDRDRVGLSGPNGAGKTTLLRMLAGLEKPDDGAITRPANLTVGYLPQDGLTHGGRTLFQEASQAFESLLTLQAEMQNLEVHLGDSGVPPAEHERRLTRYSEVQEAFRHQGGYDIEARVTAVLRGLGFSSSDFDRPTETFSGGWQMRIALATLLLRRPWLLLMDEPTNHLDLEARNWLEGFLLSYPYAVVLVSHDRFFLESVVTAIAEVGLRTLTTYRGSYSAYLVERDARLDRLREQRRRQDEEVTRIQAFIDRFRYQATKAAQVQSRVKMLGKIRRSRFPPSASVSTSPFRPPPRAGEPCSSFVTYARRTADVCVFDNVTVHIERGDRIALVGPNGRWQIDPHAYAVGGGTTRQRDPRRRPTRRGAILRARRSHSPGRVADSPRDAGIGVARAYGPGHSEHPRWISV